jgi:hypothetical protein
MGATEYFHPRGAEGRQGVSQLSKARVSEIRQLHGEIDVSLRTTLDKAIRVGELLTEQKASLEHGEWLPWIETNCPFSERTARYYIRFWERRGELKSASVADLAGARKLLSDQGIARENPCSTMGVDGLLAEMVRLRARIRTNQETAFRPPEGLYRRWGQLVESAQDAETILALQEADLALEDAALSESWAASDPEGFSAFFLERAHDQGSFWLAWARTILARCEELEPRARLDALTKAGDVMREWGGLFFEIQMKEEAV